LALTISPKSKALKTLRMYRHDILDLMRLILRVLSATPIIFFGLLPIPAKARVQKDCGKVQEQELNHSEPKNWESFYRLFKQFGECDDGALGEGFSEDVAQLLSKQWAHIDALGRLTAADKAFERFVLRHIDATLSENELKTIANNSRSHCPVGEKHLCQVILTSARNSLDELSK
jgi:hypothetical protein